MSILFAGAFRPMFLAAGLWGAAAMVLWLLMLGGGVALPIRLPPLDWHVHEMLFGYVMAAIAGFLLTAIPNWTDRPPLTGAPLAVLTGLWVIGRLACLVSGLLPAWLGIGLDLLFPIALGGIVARELIASGNRRNIPLLIPVCLLGAANLLMHLESVGIAVPLGIGWRLGLGCVLMLMAVIGGRIVPAFTRNWLKARNGPEVPAADRLDTIALASLAAALALWVGFPDHAAVGALLLVAGLLHLGRLARWRGMATRGEPLLWVLHVGYLWLAGGVGLMGLAVLTPAVPMAAGVHALTAGAIGTMTLAVMSRATLGHMGRALVADRGLTVVFVLVLVAAVLRVVSAWPTGGTMVLLMLAGVAWVTAFALFVLRHIPMALSQRA